MNTDDEVEIAEDNLFKRYCELTISRESQDKTYTLHINTHPAPSTQHIYMEKIKTTMRDKYADLDWMRT